MMLLQEEDEEEDKDNVGDDVDDDDPWFQVHNFSLLLLLCWQTISRWSFSHSL